MAKLHVKKGDTVLVLNGKDRGNKGTIIKVLINESKVVVEGVAKVSRHKKPSNKKGQDGIVVKESPIDSSNVMLICPKCAKPTRTNYLLLENSQKVRVCKKCGAQIITVNDKK